MTDSNGASEARSLLRAGGVGRTPRHPRRILRVNPRIILASSEGNLTLAADVQWLGHWIDGKKPLWWHADPSIEFWFEVYQVHGLKRVIDADGQPLPMPLRFPDLMHITLPTGERVLTLRPAPSTRIRR